MQKLSRLLVVALAGALFASGCGSSSTSTTTSTQTSSGQSSSGQTATKPSALGPAEAARAQASCRQKLQAQASLSASAKAKLEQICAAIGHSDPSALRKATQEACVQLLNASHIPAGVAKERALAVCRAP